MNFTGVLATCTTLSLRACDGTVALTRRWNYSRIRYYSVTRVYALSCHAMLSSRRALRLYRLHLINTKERDNFHTSSKIGICLADACRYSDTRRLSRNIIHSYKNILLQFYARFCSVTTPNRHGELNGYVSVLSGALTIISHSLSVSGNTMLALDAQRRVIIFARS